MNKRFRIIIIASFIILFVWLLLSTIARYKKGMNEMFKREAELQKHEVLAEAMLNYAKATGEFPKQLDDLVVKKILPNTSNLYTSSYDDNPSRVSRFEESAYEVSNFKNHTKRFYIFAKPSKERDINLQEGFFEVNDFLDNGIREVQKRTKLKSD